MNKSELFSLNWEMPNVVSLGSVVSQKKNLNRKNKGIQKKIWEKPKKGILIKNFKNN
jgi:hypothetical protein